MTKVIAITIAKLRGLQQISLRRGTITALALYHRQNLLTKRAKTVLLALGSLLPRQSHNTKCVGALRIGIINSGLRILNFSIEVQLMAKGIIILSLNLCLFRPVS